MTALEAIFSDKNNQDQQIRIVYGDTLSDIQDGDFVAVGRSSEPEDWSYAPDDLASVGLYGFSDPRDFCRALDGYSGPGEAFVAPLYNHIIRNGNLVEALEIDSSFVVPLGTPGEVCEACISNNWPLPVEFEPWCIQSRIATKR